MWPALIAAGAGLAGGLLQNQGQRETNASNEGIADRATAANMAESQRNRDFQAQQASAQMGFQERMSNTAHQREAEDLKAAGINPILGSMSGSSSPSGAAASGSQASAETSTNQNPWGGLNLSGIVTNAYDAMKMAGEIDMQSSQKKLIEAQIINSGVDSAVKRKGIPEAEFKNDMYDIARPLVKKAKNALQTGSMNPISWYSNAYKTQQRESQERRDSFNRDTRNQFDSRHKYP